MRKRELTFWYEAVIRARDEVERPGEDPEEVEAWCAFFVGWPNEIWKACGGRREAPFMVKA